MESPFASRLGTTFVPSDDEAVEIKKILDKYTPKLAQISSELARVRALYEELENQHKQLADEMGAHRGLLSLLRRDLLPTDILQEIFLSCLPISHDSIITKKEAPVLLTQVCRNWRRIALNTPLLWASIHIPITFNNSPLDEEVGDASFSDAATDLRMTKRVSTVREWLGRSKDCPLSFTFGSDPNIFGSNRHCDDIIYLLQSHLGRWHRVTINASKYYIAMFTALDTRQMPLLESITVCDANMGGWEGPAPITMSTENRRSQLSLFESPSLRNLRVSWLTENIASLPVRWAALSHLSLFYNQGPTEIPQIFDLLKACTRLVSFQLTTAFSSATTTQPSFHPTSNTVVSLPFLETFSFVHHISFVYPNSFDSVEFPALREIDYHWPHRPNVQPPLLSLLRKQGHTITTLTTNTELFSEENFRSCLRCCPHLKKLFIHAVRSPEMRGEEIVPTMDTSLLESLSSPSSSGEYLCPELEVLESSVFAICSDQDVLDFLARKQAGTLPGMSKLKSLGLLFWREQEQPLAELVRPYIEEGLDLGLVYKPQTNRATSMYDHMPFNFDSRPMRQSGPALF